MATEFAKLAKEARASYICAISMAGAEKLSSKKNAYAQRAKHDMEQNISSLGFERFAVMWPDWVNRKNDWRNSYIHLEDYRGSKPPIW